MKRKILYAGLSVVMVLAGCGKEKGRQMPPTVVSAVAAAIQPQPLSLMAVGMVEPIETVTVRPQAGGVITGVHFAEGQEVRTGQRLFTIDPRPYQAALHAALAQQARDSSQAVYTAMQAQRYAELSAKDFVTREQFEQARTQAEMLKAALQVDQAAVEQARLNLGYTKVTAPIFGRTGALLVKRGNVVSANGPGLVVINQMSPIRVSFTIPGTDLPRVQYWAAQGKLKVHVNPARDGGEAGQLEGQLSFLDNTVDSGTGTVTLKAEFANAEEKLWPGQFVDVELVLTIETEALTVPANAVVTGQNGTFVYVVTAENRAEKRAVKVNRTLGELIVLDDGIKAGEMVVTDGQVKLVPGAAVSVKGGRPDTGRPQ
ncbi:MAG TPA: efflux RND transporter periplasmic adaptor subunit [bacterium]|nr:efflux RND transporter periplasmic adaptor subunit [bacterium]HPR89335.1 efflux RND transporter periplasmic adaptor subunit [bacterium]